MNVSEATRGCIFWLYGLKITKGWCVSVPKHMVYVPKVQFNAICALDHFLSSIYLKPCLSLYLLSHDNLLLESHPWTFDSPLTTNLGGSDNCPKRLSVKNGLSSCPCVPGNLFSKPVKILLKAGREFWSDFYHCYKWIGYNAMAHKENASGAWLVARMLQFDLLSCSVFISTCWNSHISNL